MKPEAKLAPAAIACTFITAQTALAIAEKNTPASFFFLLIYSTLAFFACYPIPNRTPKQ